MRPKLTFRRINWKISEGFSNWCWLDGAFSQSESNFRTYFWNSNQVAKIFDAKKIWFRYRYPVMTWIIWTKISSLISYKSLLFSSQSRISILVNGLYDYYVSIYYVMAFHTRKTYILFLELIYSGYLVILCNKRHAPYFGVTSFTNVHYRLCAVFYTGFTWISACVEKW